MTPCDDGAGLGTRGLRMLRIGGQVGLCASALCVMSCTREAPSETAHGADLDGSSRQTAASPTSAGTPWRDAIELEIGAGVAGAPPRARAAARAWVSALNSLEPETILAFATDSMATLYVLPSATWTMLSPDAQRSWCDIFGARWRAYLQTAVGSWDRTGSFAPGFVVLDSIGEACRNVNGTVTLQRSRAATKLLTTPASPSSPSVAP